MIHHVIERCHIGIRTYSYKCVVTTISLHATLTYSIDSFIFLTLELCPYYEVFFSFPLYFVPKTMATTRATFLGRGLSLIKINQNVCRCPYITKYFHVSIINH